MRTEYLNTDLSACPITVWLLIGLYLAEAVYKSGVDLCRVPVMDLTL